jgi:DNA primase
VLFGADLARAQAARAGQVIAVEGYTDVLALHQNGMRQSVGIMGTSLTEEQVGELVRMAPTVLLALDSDSAGQEAMLRAAKVAVGRKLELRVVTLPSGRDPADFLAAPGGGAELARLVDGSVPFVRFRVERALDRGDLRGPEGKDAVLTELRPVFAELPPSVLREDLMALVADRMGLDATLVGQLLGRTGAATRQGERAAVPVLVSANPGEQQERTFLALCIARPDLAPAVLTSMDLESMIVGEHARRLAVHLRDAPGTPPPDDLVDLHRELTVRAGGMVSGDAAFEMERLRLEIAHVDRETLRARRERTANVTPLRLRREELRRAYEAASERDLEASRQNA